MARLILTFWLAAACSLLSFSQTHPLSGDVMDENANPLVFASVLLLNPADSTLQFFGITNQQGHFDIRNVKENKYLLQVSYMGYQTLYRPVSLPLKEGNNLGTILMKPVPVNVREVKVVGERVPLMIRKDTVEYNAAAFKLRSDAVTEDLLKKLPGIEVDRAGNVKAMGEDVKKVYVDGKEFFGNDPKIATKNIPAKAVDKVQVYDRKSEESMFTNINDGSREKTINLQLQEGQKNAVFGDLTAGGGTGDRFLGSAKAYRFTDKIQLAGLGMINNVNQYGFSMNDYLNFSGGMAAMAGGGGNVTIRISNDGSFPVNFGQPVSGLNTSGAGGLNFSRSTGSNDRFFVSYVGTGSDKNLHQDTRSENFLSQSSYIQNDSLRQDQNNYSHRLNFGWRNRIDSLQNLNLNGNFSLMDGSSTQNQSTINSTGNAAVSRLTSFTRDRSDRYSGDLSGSYILKIVPGRTVLELSGNGSYSSGLSKTNSQTDMVITSGNSETKAYLYQDNTTGNLNFSANASLTQKIGKNLYLEPSLRFGSSGENLNRTQGFTLPVVLKIDSLSPRFDERYRSLRSGVMLSRSNDKIRLTLGMHAEASRLSGSLDGNKVTSGNYFYFVPSFSYENEYKAGKRIMINLNSSVNPPAISQLLPVINNLNPLSTIQGNPHLKPEYSNRLGFHWLYFDQFSFTSLFAGINGTYTKDKINWDRTISGNLQQRNTYYNAGSDYRAGGNASFSTPVRWLGIKINLNFEENWSRGFNRINAEENRITNLSHRISLSADNRKKEKIDINTGVELTLSRSWYSIRESLNNDYSDFSWFGEIRYNPTKNWNFEVTADITRYGAESFGKSVQVPLIGGEITRYIMKNNRGTLTLRCFDLLNRNRIVQRISELNYLREVRSNSMGRYIMLSFSYRLNKFGQAPGGMDVRVMRR